MRIIAGEYRRRMLIAPQGLTTRPTSDRLRESLFNVLTPRIAGARFLDLYAGSGANGIEALSRGAVHAVFVEKAASAIDAMRENIAALKIGSRCTVETRGVMPFLRTARARQVVAFNIVFLDPPYDLHEEYGVALSMLGGEAQTLLAAGAIVVAEHRRAKARLHGQTPHVLEPSYGLLKRTRVLEQGDAALSFYASGALNITLV